MLVATPKTPSPAVLLDDNHVIAVYKPPGISTQGDLREQASLFDWVKEWIRVEHQKPGNVFLGLVQRLDRPVGGVVVFAKTSKAASRLSSQLRDREMKKVYWAWVDKPPANASGELVDFLLWDDEARKARVSLQREGKEARLSYQVVRQVANRTLVEIELGTGRKHQIRVQLAQAGMPISGDQKYGSQTSSPVEGIALLARRVRFQHPTRDEQIEVAVPDSILQETGWQA